MVLKTIKLFHFSNLNCLYVLEKHAFEELARTLSDVKTKEGSPRENW